MKDIHYDQVIELGFKRIELDDDAFYQTYGYHCFLVQLKIKDITFDWDSTTMSVEMIRYSSKKVSATRLATLKISSLNELKTLVDFYKSTENKKFSLTQKPTVQINYEYF